MIFHKTKEEIELLRESSLLVSKTLAELAGHIKPGVSSLQLDKIAETFIRDHNGVPAFKGYRGFPNSLCTSVNAQIVHGIPNNDPLKEDDMISIDCGIKLNGYYGDSAYSFALSNISDEVEALMAATKKSLFIGIEQAVIGKRIGDIGFAIQDYVEQKQGYHIVRELVGHGVGKSLHEDPEVPNYGKRGSGPKMIEGLVIAIEPMVNLGTRSVVQLSDGWTVKTADGSPSAHYELMVALQRGEADVLSTFSYIEEAEEKNKNLKPIVTTSVILGN